MQHYDSATQKYLINKHFIDTLLMLKKLNLIQSTK